MKMFIQAGVAAAIIASTVAPASAQGLLQRLRDRFDAKDDIYCRGLGVQPGDQAYVQCRLYLRQERKQRLSDIGDSFDELGRQFNRPSIDCTSTRFGNTVTTNCR